MRRHSTLVVLSGLILFFAAPPVASAVPGLSVTCRTVNKEAPSDHATTTVETTLEVKPGRQFKDLHVFPPTSLGAPAAKPTLPDLAVKDGTVDVLKKNVDGSYTKVATWKCYQAADGIHIAAQDDGADEDSLPDGLADGTYKFELTWAKNSFTAQELDREARFVGTDNGYDAEAKSAHYEWVNILEPRNQTPKAKGLPVLGMVCQGPGRQVPIVCRVGEYTPLCVGVDSVDYAGWSFELFTAKSPNPARDDEIGIGLNVVEDPVPLCWGLEFDGFAGSIGVDGFAEDSPVVFVPPSGPLSGEHFYVVLAIRDGQGDLVFVGEAVRVEIL